MNHGYEPQEQSPLMAVKKPPLYNPFRSPHHSYAATKAKFCPPCCAPFPLRSLASTVYTARLGMTTPFVTHTELWFYRTKPLYANAPHSPSPANEFTATAFKQLLNNRSTIVKLSLNYRSPVPRHQLLNNHIYKFLIFLH